MVRPRATSGHTRVVSIGTATPPNKYTQAEVLDLLGLDDPRLRSLFLSSHIKTRHLVLPIPQDGVVEAEEAGSLVDKHKEWSLRMGSEAIRHCLEPLGLKPVDIDYLCCVSSTGYLCPGISAHLIKQDCFREEIHRIDVLGMGCNAGMNAMNPTAAFASLNPGKLALMLCVEVCSAAYVHDGTIRSAIVNSLFGDGAVAVLMEAGGQQRVGAMKGPRILGFESQIVTAGIHTMRFDLWEGKLSFYLDRDIPYVLGSNVEKPVTRLLKRFQLKRRDITHWVVHSGGRKVIDSIKYNIDLTDHDVRHTHHVLRNYGNISSGSFLFSLKCLLDEGVTREGDFGIFMAMGPGASIETGLVQW